jgi:pimeloyl-ACP methyl ester carboxylesterase
MSASTPELAAIDEGTGEVVLLLHSGGLSGRQWRRLIEQLRGTHRVIAPDFLGSGANEPWPAGAPFHFHQDVDAVEALVSRVGERVHVVGHSYGGLVGLTLARLHPAQVRSLAVYDPVAFGVIHDAQDEEGLADLARSDANPIFLDDALGGSEPWLEGFVDYWNGPGSWQTMPAPSREAFLRVGRKVYLEVKSLLTDRTGRAAYAALDVPALILVGERSPVAAQRATAWLASSLRRGTLERVQGAGHMGPISHAAPVNAAIVRHILEASAGAAAPST